MDQGGDEGLAGIALLLPLRQAVFQDDQGVVTLCFGSRHVVPPEVIAAVDGSDPSDAEVAGTDEQAVTFDQRLLYVCSLFVIEHSHAGAEAGVDALGSRFQARVTGVGGSDDGLLPEDLRHVCVASGARAIQVPGGEVEGVGLIVDQGLLQFGVAQATQALAKAGVERVRRADVVADGHVRMLQALDQLGAFLDVFFDDRGGEVEVAAHTVSLEQVDQAEEDICTFIVVHPIVDVDGEGDVGA